MKTVSEHGLQFVAAREACVLTTYIDGKKLAIGFGDNDRKLKLGDTISMEQAIERFVQKSVSYSAAVNRLCPGIELKQNHFDCLFSLVYNYGAVGLARKTNIVPMVWRLYEIGNDETMLKIVGEEIARQPTNNKRRRREASMFVTGDYGDLTELLLWEGDPGTTSPKLVPMPTFLKEDQ